MQEYLRDDVLEFFIKMFPIQSFIMFRILRNALRKYSESDVIK